GGYVALPLVGLFAARRQVFRRDSPWLLPALIWLFLLPTSVLSFYKMGGSSNSLNGVLYLAPMASLAAVGWLRDFRPSASSVWLATAVWVVTVPHLLVSPLLPLRPLTVHLETGEILARRFPGRIFFPWNPLLTFYTEGRFYHTEDGLNVRRVSGAARPPAAIRRDLPPAWSITAIPGWRDSGVYKQLQPPDARLGFFGKWTIYTWSPPPGQGTPP
ncbi:MAG: hypothetical protein NTV51_00370, partial [Verrucomicrobia bacterium]|nr:hypothetical protein [Verrucomicrobiota bacterium]